MTRTRAGKCRMSCVKKNALLLECPCCTRDEGRSFGAGFQEQASNNRKLLRPNGRGGERYGKGVTRLRHVRSRETNASEPPGRGPEMHTDDIKTGERHFLREEHGGDLVTVHVMSGVEEA